MSLNQRSNANLDGVNPDSITQKVALSAPLMILLAGLLILVLSITGVVPSPSSPARVAIATATVAAQTVLLILFPVSMFRGLFSVLLLSLSGCAIAFSGGVYGASIISTSMLCIMASIPRYRPQAGILFSALVILGLVLNGDALGNESAPRLLAALVLLPAPLAVLLRTDLSVGAAQILGMKILAGAATLTTLLLAVFNNFPLNSLLSALIAVSLLAYLWAKSELPKAVRSILALVLLALVAVNSIALGSAFSTVIPVFVLIAYLLFNSQLALLGSIVVLMLATVGISLSEVPLDGQLVARAAWATLVLLVGLHLLMSQREPPPVQTTSLADYLKRSRLTFAGVALAGLSLVVTLSFINLRTHADLEAHQELRYELLVLEKTLIDRETGVRGFALTANSQFLEPYNIAQQSLAGQLEQISPYISAESNSTLLQAIGQRYTYYQEIFALISAGQEAQLGVLLNSGRGKEYTDTLRAAISFELEQLQAKIDRLAVREMRANAGLNLSILVLLIFALFLMRQHQRELKRLVFDPLDQLRSDLALFGRTGHPNVSPDGSAALEIQSLATTANEMEETIRRDGLSLKQALADLQRQSAKQAQMLSVISHELRTPLASSQMMFDELNATTLNTYLGTLKANNESRLSIVDDLRYVINPSQTRAKEQSQDAPAQVVENSLQALANLAQQRKIQTHLSYDEGSNEPMEFTVSALRQITTNLCKNAYLHSQGQNVWVRLTTVPENDRTLSLNLIIEDDGRGISPEYQQTMFEAFSRGDTQAEGTGLGLYIIQDLVSLLNGRIEYFDSSKGGAGFRITAKINREKSSPQGVKHPEFTQEELDRVLVNKAILFAEDQLTLQLLTQNILTKAGARVSPCINGALALAQFEKERPDIVITDAMMPEMDGFQLCAELRRRGYDGPIIAVTAATIGNEFDRLIAAGADLALPKPLALETLKLQLAQWLRTYPEGKRAGKPEGR